MGIISNGDKDEWFESKVRTEMILDTKNPFGKHRKKRWGKYTNSMSDLSRRYRGNQWEKYQRPKVAYKEYYFRLSKYDYRISKSLGRITRTRDYFTGKLLTD